MDDVAARMRWALVTIHLVYPLAADSGYSAPTTLKSWLTKTWCGQLTPM